jgi:hypothetical protein
LAAGYGDAEHSLAERMLDREQSLAR